MSFLAAARAAAVLLLAIAPPGDADPIAGRIDAIRVKAKLPALGGAIVTGDGMEGAWGTGVRAVGHDEKVEAGDLWHLGSCTKSMTATLVALLVERGDLDWDMKLPELLPDLAKSMHDDYLDVTLVELLCHRAGVPSDLARDGVWTRAWKREGTPTEQRREMTKAVLGWKPVHAPKTKFLYSNAGVSIAGHVAETVTGKPYETLMQELLFQPLGIKSAIFGAPGDPDAKGIDQPRGHGGDGQPIEPGPRADNPPAIAPGGACAMSLADWGKYVGLHLRGAKGDVKVGAITLRAATMKKLHTAYAGDDASYAMGWSVTQRDWAGDDGLVLTHNGSNTMWYCVAWLAPNAGFAVLATTNLVGETGQGACDQVASLLIQEHLRREAAKPKPKADGG